ncbi:GTP-binding protein 2 [Thelohanellus kitauei]|uniref:GTP-binding protein 2 n=1 Tax=Thelohanellus kitauei TaxID=669202 RepID=A0A0C2J8Q2_THEKT|nr:GTP-binding protein 2 [Thelohanellus kitauei]
MNGFKPVVAHLEIFGASVVVLKISGRFELLPTNDTWLKDYPEYDYNSIFSAKRMILLMNIVKLTGLTPFRLATLASQMKWRIEEGTSETYYELGVSNSGHVKGLVDTDLRESMNNIRRVCSIIDAKIISIKRLQIKLAIKPRYICEVKLSLPEKIKLPPNKRVFLLGGPETGKTSLVGVLSKSITDDGHGRARMGFFTHAHEIKTGKTSSIAFNLLGFTQKQKVRQLLQQVVNYQIHDTQDQICKNSDFTITLIDSCGLERYFDTTIKGLTGAFPSTIFYMVNPALQAKHEIEFLKIASSWPCPLFVIFTHFDKVDPSDVQNSFHRISNIIQSLSIQKLVYINNLDEMKKFEAQRQPTEIAAFSISHVTWQNLDIVLYLLYNLASDSIQVQPENEVTQFAINTIYNIPDCGLVVSGILLSGVIKEGDDVYLGPLDDEFHLLKAQSLRSFRVTCPMLYPDQLGTIALGSSITVKNRSKKVRVLVTKGMYLLSAHPQELKRSYFANITEKYRHLIEDCGSNVNLYISNLYASAVIKIVSLEDVSDFLI